MDDDAGASVRSSIFDIRFTQPNRDPETFPTGASAAFLPWPVNYEPVVEFGERIECLLLRGGSIGRVRIATDSAVGTKGSVGANATPASFYANFVVAGEVEIGQGSHLSVAKAGDVILYDRPLPVTLSKWHTHYEDVSFAISKNEFPSIDELEKVFGNVMVLRRDTLLHPLSSSLVYLADNMSSLGRTEVAALFNACVSLLPVAIASSNRTKNTEVCTSKASPLLSRVLLDYVNQHISSADLSPQVAALDVGISVRYVHKLFAARKTTFGSYVVSKRLELVRKEMISPLGRNQAISTLAYRCGFNDLSAFNRSFKRRYGTTPGKFRANAYGSSRACNYSSSRC